jgi:hypothetical protein
MHIYKKILKRPYYYRGHNSHQGKKQCKSLMTVVFPVQFFQILDHAIPLNACGKGNALSSIELGYCILHVT